jgi:DNA repair protein RecO (recombination protein O)
MRMFSAEALLLDVFNLHDFDRIVTFLTAEQGKKKGVASGARRKYSRFAGMLQPLSKVKLNWVEKGNRDLVRISAVESIRPPRGVDEKLEDILLGAYLADHVIEFAQENEASHTLFRLLDSTLEALAGGVDRGLTARYFEAWVLRLSGLFPNPIDCPRCGRLLAGGTAVLAEEDDSIICGTCSGEYGRKQMVDARTLEFFNRLSRENLETMNANRPASAVLQQAREVSGRIRRSFLNHELKSYGVIRETLEGL